MKKPVLQSWLRISTVVILGVLILNSKHSVFAQVISLKRPPIEVLGKQGEMLIGADYYPEHWPKEFISGEKTSETIELGFYEVAVIEL